MPLKIPLSEEALKARGSWLAKRRGEKKAPTNSEDQPKREKWLSLQAKLEWNKVVPILESIGLLNSADQGVILRYCQLRARWRRYEEALAASEPTDDGHAKLARICDGVISKLARCEAALGLNPESRAVLAGYVTPPKPQQEDDGEETKESYLKLA